MLHAACGSLIVMIANGIRQSFGLAQPFVGMINDCLGVGWIEVAGTALYVVGLLLAVESSHENNLAL